MDIDEGVNDKQGHDDHEQNKVDPEQRNALDE